MADTSKDTEKDKAAPANGRVIGGTSPAASSNKQAVLDLDKRPIYTPVVTSFEKQKKGNSITLGSAILKRYYSVIDAEIYFGNNFVEDVVAINWNINQNTQPLFGYNSYIYDEVARGARIIEGAFSINFISPNYLFKLLEAAQEESITELTSYMVEQPSIKAGGVRGSVNKSLQGIIEGNNHSPIWPQTFDIDIIFGQKSGVGEPVHILLEGVVIKGCSSQALANAGSSIVETYPFVARDIKTIAQ